MKSQGRDPVTWSGILIVGGAVSGKYQVLGWANLGLDNSPRFLIHNALCTLSHDTILPRF
jgi:hypothetical protein